MPHYRWTSLAGLFFGNPSDGPKNISSTAGVTGDKTPNSVREGVSEAASHAIGSLSHDEPLSWWLGISLSNAVPKSRK